MPVHVSESRLPVAAVLDVSRETLAMGPICDDSTCDDSAGRPSSGQAKPFGVAQDDWPQGDLAEGPDSAALVELAQSLLVPKRLCLGVKSDEAVTLRFEALVAVPRDGRDPTETVLVPCPITMTVSPTELKTNRLRLVFEAPRCVEIQRPRKSA